MPIGFEAAVTYVGLLGELGRIFRPTLVGALAYRDGAKLYDPVAMPRVVILAAQTNFSDESMEYLIRHRLRCLRFLGFDLGPAMPDAVMVWRWARPNKGRPS